MIGFDCMKGSGHKVHIRVKAGCCNKKFTLHITDESQVEELVKYVKQLEHDKKATVTESQL